jgi:hypothetical protein
LRFDSIVPAAVKSVTGDVESSHVFIRDVDADGIAMTIFDGRDSQSSLSGSRRNESKNDFK